MKRLRGKTIIREHDWSPTILWCTVIVTAGIAVVSLLPFSFNVPMVGAANWYGLRLFQWGGSPTQDIVSNLLAYIPFGFLLALSARVFIARRIRLVLLVTTLVFATSITFEWVQTMMSIRVSSWTDVCNNTLGGFLGALLGANGQYVRAVRIGVLRSVRHKPLTKLAAAGAVGLVVYHLAPFDIITSTSQLRASLRQSNLWPLTGWASQLDTPAARISAWFDWSIYAVQFSVLGFVATIVRFQRPSKIIFERRRPRAAASTAFVEILAVALTIELLQLFVMSHAFELMDMFSALSGGFIGASIVAVAYPIPRLPLRPVLATLGGVMIVVMLVAGATPFDLSWTNIQPASLRQLPLAAQFHRPFSTAMADMAEYLTQFAMMATLLRLAIGTKPRSYRLVAIVPVVTMTACLGEFFQLLSYTRTPDLTAPFVAIFVAVTVAMWEPGPVDDRQPAKTTTLR